MIQTESNQLVYCIDSSNHISLVNDQWDFAAEKNHLELAKSRHIIGQPLRRFISDSATKMLMETLFDLVRVTNRPVRRQYRCDTPTMLRLMEMVLTPMPNDMIELRHELVKISARPSPVYFSTSHLSERMQHCSMCQRVFYEGQWQEVDDVAYQRPNFLNDVFLIHTVCPNCANLDNLRRGYFIGDFDL